MDYSKAQVIKAFSIENLSSFHARVPRVKNINSNLVEQIAAIDETTDITTFKKQLVKAIDHAFVANQANKKPSRRFSELLISLKYEIVELEQRERSGLSEISPKPITKIKTNNPIDALFQNAKKMVSLPNKKTNPGKTYLGRGMPNDFLDDLKSLSIVYVSGGKWNRSGHSLLKLNYEDHASRYVHINQLYYPPQVLEHEDFRRYLQADNSQVVRIRQFDNINIDEAKIAIKTATKKPWLWLGTKHNCLRFVFDMLMKSGVSAAELRPHAMGEFNKSLGLPVNDLIELEKFQSKSPQLKRVPSQQQILQALTTVSNNANKDWLSPKLSRRQATDYAVKRVIDGWHPYTALFKQNTGLRTVLSMMRGTFFDRARDAIGTEKVVSDIFVDKLGEGRPIVAEDFSSLSK